MKIDVFSDTRQPTLPYGGHGLGRVAIDMAHGLARRGHTVRLFAGKGSAAGVPVVIAEDEETCAAEYDGGADVVLDLSHRHNLSKLRPDHAIVNFVVDFEYDGALPNAVIFNEGARELHPHARVVPLGVDVDTVPIGKGGQHLVFCAKLHAMKGIDIAVDVAQQSGRRLLTAGHAFSPPPPNMHVGMIESDAELYRFLGDAYAHLAPYRYDAGSRVALNAAATGTPTLCLDCTATMYHVEHGVSGFVCGTGGEMVDALQDVSLLDRARCRQWAADTHSIDLMLDAAVQVAQAAADGEAW